jgi:hypothetical protein
MTTFLHFLLYSVLPTKRLHLLNCFKSKRIKFLCHINARVLSKGDLTDFQTIRTK